MLAVKIFEFPNLFYLYAFYPVCMLHSSWMCTFSYVSNMLSSKGTSLFLPATAICLLHLRMPVFTWLPVCVVTFDSEHGMIHNRWLPSSRGL